jgi:hypothetical protein
VGAAELTQVVRGGDGMDRALVEIRWSASQDGRPPEGHVHVVAMARAADAQSRRGMSSLDCPSCGGALAESDDVVCRYCGETLRGGRQDWALAAISAASA